ncbi:two-component system, chemotaxis family, CheB/CheR fusion protein [Nannocystis exedens]|uniref:protein-glutamate O-methyltransferase n=1 Tax=Nannocystis exedens TaxID=54 RepID=A0A1I2J002_9BACT|nr:CheR family methyltransferase [Nannocystis exedens]PCC67167.1 putative ATPase [Nannocystis exedens]SFF46276.1 two-component system, chemotaxis family, CheB/CheR fusion protein [Nannocystis exedens]
MPITPAPPPPQPDSEAEDGEEDTPAETTRRPSGLLLVVGVGASAGGLEPFTDILDALPADLGVAFVYVAHQASGRDSALADILHMHTAMPIVLVKEEVALEPNHVYLAPPGVQLTVAELGLVPSARPDDGTQYTPIDVFMASLAKELETCAVGVILSGSGADGSSGLREIKGVGGITIVQDPETARYDSMPRAAIATGSVDLVLNPPRIAEELQRIGRHPYVRSSYARRPGHELVIHQEQRHCIFTMLRNASGVDFTHDKPPTIRRRLQRRMVLHKLDSVEQYIKYMRENPEEVSKLYQDLLIHVTRFFRDPESFKALAAEVFPQIMQQRRGLSPIRLWLPGCSTGEEAYSVAIALLEVLGEEASAVPVQIFATDVSETAIEHARNGLYSENIVSDLSPERLRRFFTKTDGKYRIAKVVRDLCVFARQDVTRDPPFSKLDLILCRNVLIYMGAVLQRKLMTVFHYALKPSGFLMLGGAETVGAQADLFAVLDKKHRIFVKRPIETPSNFQIPVEYNPSRSPHRGPRLPAEMHTPHSFQCEANRLVLDRYGPPGVIVDENFQIVQFRGKTGLYLEPAPGDAVQSLNLLKTAREGLLHGLQTALYGARKSDKPVRKRGLRVAFNGAGHDLDLHVIPLSVPGEERHFLVLFEEAGAAGDPPQEAGPPPPQPPSSDDERVKQLQKELAASREHLQSIIQDLEAANEELQSANEEILSSNEELQSTHEELDTAKEELQSTNEELNTVNEELHGRNEELSRVNSDLVNLLGCVEIAIVIVGSDLSIRRFTPMAEKVLNLIPTDIGRPISQIKPNIECPGLEKMIARVIDTVTIQEMNVRDSEGNWYSLRIRPSKNVENRIDGAVLALFDIASRRHEPWLRQARDGTRALVEIVRQPVVMLDGHLRVQAINRAFTDLFGFTADNALHRLVYDLGGGAWDVPPLHRLLDDLLPRQGRCVDFRLEHEFVRGQPMQLGIDASRVDGGDPGTTIVVLAIHDATRFDAGTAPPADSPS